MKRSNRRTSMAMLGELGLLAGAVEILVMEYSQDEDVLRIRRTPQRKAMFAAQHEIATPSLAEGAELTEADVEAMPSATRRTLLVHWGLGVALGLDLLRASRWSLEDVDAIGERVTPAMLDGVRGWVRALDAECAAKLEVVPATLTQERFDKITEYADAMSKGRWVRGVDDSTGELLSEALGEMATAAREAAASLDSFGKRLEADKAQEGE